MSKRYRYLILIAIIIILMLASIISVMQLRSSTKESFVVMSDQLVSHTTSIIELWIDDQIRMARQIGLNENIIELCLDPSNPEKQEAATNYLNEIQAMYPYYENLPIAIKTDTPIKVKITDQIIEIQNGEFIVDSANQSTIGKGGLDYNYISEIFKGQPYYISNIYYSITRGNPIFVISVPIINNDEIIGVSLVSPKMNYLTKLYVDSISINDTGYMFLVDSSYATIAHKNRDFILNDEANTHDIVKYITTKIDNDEFFFEADIHNANKYYYGKKLNIDNELIENDLYVVITQNKVEVYQSVHAYALFSIILALTTSFLAYKLLVMVSTNHLQHEKELQLLAMNSELEIKVSERTLELEEMTKRDSMTLLYNHDYIIKYLDSAIVMCENACNLSVAVLDIDNFKNVNDTYGHLVGDNVIKAVAKIIQENLRERDIVGRYGGEEFLIILIDLNYNECIRIIERIRKTIAEHEFEEIDHHVTVSIGLANFQNENTNSIIRRADKMMYRAKYNGKNLVVHDKIIQNNS